MGKQEQRSLIKERLSKLDNKEKLDDLIFSNLVNSNLVKGFNLCIYNSTKSEVGTKKIISYYLDNGFNVFLPVSKEKDIALVKIDKNTKYTKGLFGILEPQGEEVDAVIDTCITPLLGYDKNKNRLGKGKGYYDRFFAKHKCKKIALAYSCQEVDEIDASILDIKIDYIINENGVF